LVNGGPTKARPTRDRTDRGCAAPAARCGKRRCRGDAAAGGWHHRRPRRPREGEPRGCCADRPIGATPPSDGEKPRGWSRALWAIESPRDTTAWLKPVTRVPVVWPWSSPGSQATTRANPCGTRSEGMWSSWSRATSGMSRCSTLSNEMIRLPPELPPEGRTRPAAADPEGTTPLRRSSRRKQAARSHSRGNVGCEGQKWRRPNPYEQCRSHAPRGCPRCTASRMGEGSRRPWHGFHRRPPRGTPRSNPRCPDGRCYAHVDADGRPSCRVAGPRGPTTP